jgi:cbb3-type cytochrome oxidase cytochrome c subunit
MHNMFQNKTSNAWHQLLLNPQRLVPCSPMRLFKHGLWHTLETVAACILVTSPAPFHMPMLNVELHAAPEWQHASPAPADPESERLQLSAEAQRNC